jgi:hypothetical protein
MERTRQSDVEDARAALRGDKDLTVAKLMSYLVDRPEDVRRDIYALYWSATISHSRNHGFGRTVLTLMLKQVSLESPRIRGQLLKWMQDFQPDDFDQSTTQLVLQLPWTPDFCPDVIRLIGIAGARQANPQLKAQLQKEPLPDNPPPGYYVGNTWTALLALSRMGDERALARVIQQVRNERDIIVRASILFKDLGYTRQPGAFEALRGYLNSESRLPQIKSNVPGRLEAAYAATEFVRHVQGFPIQEPDPSEEQVLQARTWANAQKTFHIR